MKRIGMGAMAMAMAMAISSAAMSTTVNKCEKDGKTVYTDEPCNNAAKVDVTPTQGLNKWTGVELRGTNTAQQAPRPTSTQSPETAKDQQPHIEPPRVNMAPNPPQQPRYAAPTPYTPAPAGLATQIASNLWPVALIFTALAMLAVIAAKHGTKQPGKVWPKNPLTNREQAMFFRLQQTLPDHVILAQVAFSALLNAKQQSVRNTFNRKVTDFVVCTKAFEVVAVIELDDATHFGKLDQDAKRDQLMQRAGYKTIRFANVPDHDELLNAMQSLTTMAS